MGSHFQLLQFVSGGCSWRRESAKSVHFCSCSLRVSLLGPLSGSSSGSSICGTAISSIGNLSSLHFSSTISINRPSRSTSLSMVPLSRDLSGNGLDLFFSFNISCAERTSAHVSKRKYNLRLLVYVMLVPSRSQRHTLQN